MGHSDYLATIPPQNPLAWGAVSVLYGEFQPHLGHCRWLSLAEILKVFEISAADQDGALNQAMDALHLLNTGVMDRGTVDPGNALGGLGRFKNLSWNGCPEFWDAL